MSSTRRRTKKLAFLEGLEPVCEPNNNNNNNNNNNKVNSFLYRPWRPLGLREVEALAFSDIRLIVDGSKVVRPTRRPLFTLIKIPGTHFC
jgi:hypothetical protein